MKFKLGSKLNYNIPDSTTFIFNISVVKNSDQNVLDEDLQIEPSLDFEEYVSPFVENRYIRIIAPPGTLQLSYYATVELLKDNQNLDSIPEISPAKFPLETLYYLFPSRYCQSDRLMRLAQHEFGQLKPGYSRVTAICNWIYDNVTYLSGSTNAHTSAYDTATERAGVCRDFAHLGIAFCRALNIPARFVSAYAYRLEPPDFHACFEAYLGDRWYLFDATRLVPLDGLIRIGTGRDAADVSFATIFGSAQMETMKIFVEKL
ncbi:MAG TPA: transglutaminase family protein [Cyanobacteria bacterium UBA12227]|nr:transglutaminase family protein [Cyanobacteria bacterium UBA12227]HAX90452.1 transglutaminase family protein [Cyanobacteria bacterium UBA11370]HBY78345.1 transglutaminase family protein [Cyanobacteria bacterium UBA11148]